jgi:hypothetical protein
MYYVRVVRLIVNKDSVFPKLEKLVLSKTRITDEGLQKLANVKSAVPCLQYLRELHLVSVQITDKCVDFLRGTVYICCTYFVAFKSLTHVNFGPSTSLTSCGLSTFKSIVLSFTRLTFVEMLQENLLNASVKSNACNEFTIIKHSPQPAITIPNMNSDWNIDTLKAYLLGKIIIE